jgi:ABC-type amino acid transport substrate-binding protein
VSGRARRARLAALVLGALTLARAVHAELPLRVCLDENSAPLSWRDARGEGGFDLGVARAVAQQLGRELAVHWFRGAGEEGFGLPTQIGVLLAQGACELAGGFPLTRDALAAPAVPEIFVALPSGERTRVRLGELRHTRPYQALALTLVLTPRAPQAGALEELGGLRLAVERESLAEAVAAAHAPRLGLGLTRYWPEGEALFEALERGDADAALVERQRFDVYRRQLPATALRASDYVHPLAINTGLAGLERARRLLEAADRALDALSAQGELARIAAREQLTYHAPREPEVLPPLTARVLLTR